MSYKHPFDWSPAPFTVFNDENLQKQVQNQGYAVVDFMDKSVVNSLLEVYHNEHNLEDDNGGMFYSVYSQDIEYRNRVHTELATILEDRFTSFFKDYSNGLNFFINKLSGDESAFSIHQDSSAVDEYKHSALSVWIPLQDVDETNGALWIVEKTHQLFSPFRSVSFSPPFSEIKKTVRDYLKPISMKAGQALIFDARVIHTSGINTSEKDRITVVSGILPKEASFQLSYQDSPSDPIELYAQADDFLINYPNFYFDCTIRPTTGEKIGETPFAFPKITAEAFEQTCADLNIERVNLFKDDDPIQNFITDPITTTKSLKKVKFREYTSDSPQAIRMLKDDEKERQLCEEGYVIMPFFDEDELKTLIDYFHNEHKESSEKIYAMSHSEDLQFKKGVNDWIAQMYAKRVEEHFVDTIILGGTFVAKPANGKGLITPHRDWNLVDEERFRSCNIWVPLVDTNAENGAIEILPKSHLIGPTYRGPNITNQLRDVGDLLWENLELAPMKAGHAFIYDHRFIHASKDNNSSEIRPASACAITNSNAEYRFYHVNSTQEGDQIEEYESSPDYLLREDRFERPTTIKQLSTPNVSTDPYDSSHFDGMEMKPVAQTNPKPGFLSRLKSLIKQ